MKQNKSGNGEFKKEIGLFGGMSVICGIMIGSGIFYLGSYVLQRSGYSLGLALICWRSTPVWDLVLSCWWSAMTTHRIIPRKLTWAGAVIYWYQRSKHVTELDETFRAAACGRERSGN